MQEEHYIKLFELAQLNLFLGSVVYCMGAVYQVFAILVLNKDRRISRIVGIVLLTRICAFLSSYMIWILLFQNTDVMAGPILLPALVAEVPLSILLLKVFRYKAICKSL
ncbi:MAG: hypothetical protein R3F48_06270 [Candidatus Zixiibacteriota bacterium]